MKQELKSTIKTIRTTLVVYGGMMAFMGVLVFSLVLDSNKNSSKALKNSGARYTYYDQTLKMDIQKHKLIDGKINLCFDYNNKQIMTYYSKDGRVMTPFAMDLINSKLNKCQTTL